MVQTRSRASAASTASPPSSTSSLTPVLTASIPAILAIPSQQSHSYTLQQPVKIKLTLAPEEEATTSTPSSPTQSTFTPANTSLALPSTSSRLSAPPTTDDEASDVDTTLPNDTSGIANVDDDENAGDESQNDNGDAGYAAKLPFWVSANLVVRHPSSKDKETCVACLKDLEEERMRELRNPDSPDQREALQVIDQKSKWGFLREERTSMY